MEIEQKVEILKRLDTKELIAKLQEYENELQKAMTEKAACLAKHYGYVCSRGTDCPAVKEMIAILLAQAPETIEVEKPLTKTEKASWLKEQKKLDPSKVGFTIDNAPATETVSKILTENDKKAWLERQRKENKELSEAISKQHQVAFLLEDYDIKTEMAKKRLESTRAVLALKTAQIKFFASD